MVLAAGDDDDNPILHTTGCACGYGATIQFADGTLGTPYCYSNTTLAKQCVADKAPACFVTVRRFSLAFAFALLAPTASDTVPRHAPRRTWASCAGSSRPRKGRRTRLFVVAL